MERAGLEQQTVTQLRAQAKEMGLAVKSKMKKQELIDIILLGESVGATAKKADAPKKRVSRGSTRPNRISLKRINRKREPSPSGRIRTGRSRARTSQTKRKQTDRNKANLNKTNPNKANPNKSNLNKARQNRLNRNNRTDISRKTSIIKKEIVSQTTMTNPGGTRPIPAI